MEQSNKEYAALLESKVGNDSYVSTSMQTIDNMMLLRKHKDAQTVIAQSGTSSSQWDVRTITEAADAVSDATAAEQHAMTVGQPTFAAHAASQAVWPLLLVCLPVMVLFLSVSRERGMWGARATSWAADTPPRNSCHLIPYTLCR